MSQSPQELLKGQIVRFIDDSNLVHDFVKGDDTVTIHGEAGDYPSLAKLIKDIKAGFQRISQSRFNGMVVRRYEFPPSTNLKIKHSLGTKFFDFTIVNSDGARLIGCPALAVDENNIEITFSEIEKGYLVVTYYECTQYETQLD